MAIELQQLRGFLAVAGEGSFTAAARKTFRTQPTVSQQVASLEEELGAKLFDRIGKRRVRLTRAGEILQDVCAPVVASMEAVTSSFRERLTGEVTSPLRMAARSSTIQYVLPAIIDRFRKGHPKVPITILARDRDGIVDVVRKGEVDLGILSLERVPPGLRYEPFASYPRALVAPRTHPLSTKRTIALKDLEAVPLILPPRGSNTRHIVEKAFEEKGLSLRVALEVQGTEAALAYVASGIGLSIMTIYDRFPGKDKRLKFRELPFLPKAERGILRREKATLSAAGQEMSTLLGLKAAR